ncbi:hypothetical protein DSM106972_006600 [Dulcicalothrix desertica PCC 7102]|uniref:Uncharacterized protein n=1 Tax=Dulcicalothrix desertica PCC 7102 TaxID=232991 RepID=A0A433VVQ8_9CYAN|nr:hypothetical protein DSM106972_006600 [Dulcicalothrix desertica PCC 7102]TWH40854.1 hypothetical protein CAL7102_10215 [Dulcicalothrix desertica PCC 7102]
MSNSRRVTPQQKKAVAEANFHQFKSNPVNRAGNLKPAPQEEINLHFSTNEYLIC